MEELLLWRWSTTVQITSAVVLAIFMVAFGRAVGRPDTRWWAGAYVANLGAMAVTVLYWYGIPPDLVPGGLTRFGYMASKTLFVVYLAAGVFAFKHPRGHTPFTVQRNLLLATGVGLFGAFFAPSINLLGLTQHAIIAVSLGIGAWWCFRRPIMGLGWLGIGLAARALLGAGEATAYALTEAGAAVAQSPWMQRALAAHSSFDTGAEWLIVLGCVVAVARRSEAELKRSHAELHRANVALIEAVQRDPLTGLANRRALGPLLEVAGRHGATLMFFDLDGFKTINDEHGHDIGDACLRRFADALRDRFPDVDGLVRYAGDEFVLVDADLGPGDFEQRVQALRGDLAMPRGREPALHFSVGAHRFAGGHGDIAEALREADQAMYRNKAERRAHARA
jgi:diguanylate cyclase (GGDEF)-like protein